MQSAPTYTDPLHTSATPAEMLWSDLAESDQARVLDRARELADHLPGAERADEESPQFYALRLRALREMVVAGALSVPSSPPVQTVQLQKHRRMEITMATKTVPRLAKPFYRDDPAEKARQGKGEFADAEERNRKRAAAKKAAEAEIYDEPAEAAPDPPTEAQIVEWMAALSSEHRQKVEVMIDLQVKGWGYQNGTRKGSTLWERGRNEVVTGLIVHQADLDEIDLSEVSE